METGNEKGSIVPCITQEEILSNLKVMVQVLSVLQTTSGMQVLILLEIQQILLPKIVKEMFEPSSHSKDLI